MEPKGAANAFAGPGRPGGPRRGPGGFGPAMLIAPAFLKGAHERDDQLSKAEFLGLGEKWFTEWDTTRSGKLTEEQLRRGLDSNLGLPDLAHPGQGSPGGGPPGASGFGPRLQGANGRNGLAAAAGIDFKYVHADLEFGDQTLHDVAVRYKGNNTFMEARDSLKRSLKLDLNKYVKGQKLAGLTKLNFHNNVTDPSWMNEVLSYRLFRDAGVPAPRTSYARIYVTVPGKFEREYFGLYSVVEDIDKHFSEERFNTGKGAIFKPVTHELFAYLGEDWSAYTQIYDPKTDLSDGEKKRIIEFAKFVDSAPEAEFGSGLGDYVDLDGFARFMCVTVWLSNMDSILQMGQNYYLYFHPETRKFQFLPWDLDHSFGQFPMAGSQEQREQLSIQKPWRGSNRFLERVFKVETFKSLYLARLSEFCKSLFVPERFFQQVDEIAAAIRPAVREESEAKLARLETAVAGNTVEPREWGGPGRFMRASKPIKPFVTARARSVINQLDGKSEQTAEGDFNSGGGWGQAPPDGPGGPGGFGPARMLAAAFMDGLDLNHDQVISHEEFTKGFASWFDSWNSDKSGTLTVQQLRNGISRDLSPFHRGPPELQPPDPPPPFDL